MSSLSELLKSFVREDDGAAASEYAVLLAFVIVAVLVALRLFDISDIYTVVTNSVKTAVNNQV